MFEVKKDSMGVNSRAEYPLTVAHVHQYVYINGYSYYLIGNSEVKCDEGDKFESAFGKELAETNAIITMLKEYKRILIKMTKQPEWRKEPEKYLHREGRQFFEVTKEQHEALHSNNPNWGDFRDDFKTAVTEMKKAISNFNKRFGIKE